MTGACGVSPGGVPGPSHSQSGYGGSLRASPGGSPRPSPEPARVCWEPSSQSGVLAVWEPVRVGLGPPSEPVRVCWEPGSQSGWAWDLPQSQSGCVGSLSASLGSGTSQCRGGCPRSGRRCRKAAVCSQPATDRRPSDGCGKPRVVRAGRATAELKHITGRPGPATSDGLLGPRWAIASSDRQTVAPELRAHRMRRGNRVSRCSKLTTAERWRACLVS